MPRHGHVYWSELMTRDPARAKDFYHTVLGWDFQDMPMADGGTYVLAMADSEEAACGILDISGPDYEGVPESWFTYICVDDVDRRVAAAAAAGATLTRPIFEVPGVGRIAILREPGGAHVGWVTPTAPR